MKDWKGKLALVLILQCIHFIQADKLCVNEFGPYGPDPSYDSSKVAFTGATNMRMITAVRVETYLHNSVKYINCIGFTHADQENPCEKKTGQGIEVAETILGREEYITEVTGSAFTHIRVISFITNKGRTIGPYGANFKYMDVFTVKNGGRPLLYISGLKGMWMYQLKFYFSCLGVLELTTKAQTLAKETLEKFQSKIEEVFDVYQDYKRMHPDLSKLGCYDFPRTQSKEAEAACDMNVLLEQLDILTASTNALRNRMPRNLIHMKDYDSAKFLNEVKEAHDFHSLLTSIRFDLQTVIQSTETLGKNLGGYFKKVAEYDTQIAQQDRIYIQGELKAKKAGTNTATTKVSDRLARILKFAVGIAAIEVVERAARVAIAVAANSNPLKVITGGIDLNEILDRIEDLANALRNLAKASTLLASLNKFTNHMKTIANKFTQNTDQLAGLKALTDQFDTLTDAAQVNAMASNFVSKYGDYTPKVTNQDLAYIGTLLDTVADAGCDIIADSSGTVASVAGLIYESVTQDCTYIGAEIDTLSSYYDDWFSFQFDLVDTLAKIVRGTIAQYMAQKISDASTVIDVKRAAIGSVIVEVKYQAASQARSNILEYNDGGKRPDISKKLLFRDDDIQKLIAYKGTVQHSQIDKFVYVPGSKPSDPASPYIDVDSLLRGEHVLFQLPLNDKAWMVKYGWLPNQYAPETAFFVQYFEVYIAGLKCENGNEMRVRIDVTTGKSTKLYAESAPPSYIVTQHFVTFGYSESSSTCAGVTKQFPAVDSADLSQKSQNNLCVSTEGKVTDHADPDMTLPSLFAAYSIKMRQDSCNVIRDTSLGYTPVVTIKLKLKEVYVKIPNVPGGIDECWPDPCPSNKACVDGTLSYSCQAKRSLLDMLQGNSRTYVLE